jgi:glycosyltransferase involved in cell wall biosynthesis
MTTTMIEKMQSEFQSGNFRTAELLAADFMQKLSDNITVSDEIIRNDFIKHSIIIVCYKASDAFLELLDALSEYTSSDGYEIILVANGEPIISRLVYTVRPTDFVLIDISENTGASIGRNIGAIHARGKDLIFLDDDGQIAEGAIEKLIACKAKYNAVSVRGRIAPRTPNTYIPPHYNKGLRICPSITDIEGFVIWDKEVYNKFGGFSPVLWGHEGLHLMMKCFRFFSPFHFLYCPDAIFYHDFDQNTQKTEQKELRNDYNRKYLSYCGYEWRDYVRLMRDMATSAKLRDVFTFNATFVAALEPPTRNPLVSIITTARNAEKFIGDYVFSLRSQIYSNFEVIFVDDASEDSTYDMMKKEWGEDVRLKLFRTDGVNGRAAALNVAMEAAAGDIFVIHDVDDTSRPDRLDLTVRMFEDHPEIDCLSFYCFNETDAYRAARPFVNECVSIRARSLLGMPTVFPTFACRRRFNVEKFDEELDGGIDCDWIFRTLKSTDFDGLFVPVPMVYYRIHDGQITSSKRDTQRRVALNHIEDLHDRILPMTARRSTEMVEKITGWSPLTAGGELDIIHEYINELKAGIYSSQCKGMGEMMRYLDYAWMDAKIIRFARDYNNLKNSLERLNPNSSSAKIERIVSLSWRTRTFKAILKPFVKFFGTRANIDDFEYDPRAFFASLNKNWQRWIGRILLG